MSNTVKVLHHFLAGDQICPQRPGNDQLPAVSCHAMSHKICAGCPAAAAHLTDAATNSALVLRSDWMAYSSNNTGHHSVKIAQVKSRPKHTSLRCESLLASRHYLPSYLQVLKRQPMVSGHGSPFAAFWPGCKRWHTICHPDCHRAMWLAGIATAPTSLSHSPPGLASRWCRRRAPVWM